MVLVPGDAVQIVILILLLVLSAFFSCSETAITAVNRIRIRALAEDGNKAAERVLNLLDKQEKVISAILICNNIVNLTASSLTTSLAIRICENIGLG